MPLTLLAALVLGSTPAALLQEPGTPPAQNQPQETAKQKKQRQDHEADLKKDVELGKRVSVDADKEFKLSKNKEYIDRVNRIGQELAAIANSNKVKVSWGDARLNKFEYTFKVVSSKEDENQVNAFSLPGGFIYVFEGLIKFAESDDELAGVIAHEISHASFRHIATLEKEASKMQLVQLPALIIALLSGGRAGGDILVLTQLVGIAKNSGWSQQAELSADLGAVQYLQHSKYNPVGMLTFMERLARDQRSKEAVDWGIFRTHPPSRDRADAMVSYFNASHIPIHRSLVSTSCRTTAVPKPDGTVDAVFGKKPIFTFAGQDAKPRAEQAVKKVNEFFDSAPQLFEVAFTPKGEVLGRKEVLFKITDEDAAAAKTSVDALSAETIKAMKRSMFSLAYKVWDAR